MDTTLGGLREAARCQIGRARFRKRAPVRKMIFQVGVGGHHWHVFMLVSKVAAAVDNIIAIFN